MSDAYDKIPQVLLHVKRLRNAQKSVLEHSHSLEKIYPAFNVWKMDICLKYFLSDQ